MRAELAIMLCVVLIGSVLLTIAMFFNGIATQNKRINELQKEIQKMQDIVEVMRLDHCYMRQEFDLMRDVEINVIVEHNVSFWEGEE